MLIKICGNTVPENLNAIEALQPDFVGLIFYAKSKRYVGDQLQTFKFSIPSVGVFVNESLEKVRVIAERHSIQHLQLHGDESVAYCDQLKALGYTIFKAFGIDESFDFAKLAAYEAACDYFLFDTKTTAYGGSGKTFSWEQLKAYEGNTPFLLSGGIGLENIEDALKFSHSQLAGFDLNSRLETSPGIKDTNKTKQIIEIIRNHGRN